VPLKKNILREKKMSEKDHKKLRHCPHFAVVLVATRDGQKRCTRARCKRWSCAYCAELNTYQWRSRLRYAINVSGGSWQFITFTANRKWRGQAASLKNIRANAEKLWKRLKRLCAKAGIKKMHYVRVLERHEDDSIHVHAFVNAPLSIYPADGVEEAWDGHTLEESYGCRWLKDASAECGMGYQCDVKALDDSKRMVAYVTKYMSKQLFRAELPKGTRRLQTSHGFPTQFHRPEESDCEIHRHGVTREVVLTWLWAGYEVVDADTGTKIDREYASDRIWVI